jgi:membrane-associated phospholipid phosphatase
MNLFFNTLPQNIIRCFKGRNILWQFAAFIMTAVIVLSGFDWYYFVSTRVIGRRPFLVPAMALGTLLPLIAPIFLILIGKAFNKAKIAITGWAIGQAAFIGLIISSTYKAFTGRIHPPFSAAIDISHGFRFGFMRGGMFWGWPSSHTTIAFAMSIALTRLYPKNKAVFYCALFYALYVGSSVSLSAIHWFSEFLAGAIIGSIIGFEAGYTFYPSMKNDE